MKGSANAIEVIILQYISVSKQHVVHLKLAQGYICKLNFNKARKK